MVYLAGFDVSLQMYYSTLTFWYGHYHLLLPN